LRLVVEDTEIRAIKTGMLYDANTIHTIATVLKSSYHDSNPLPPLICDPVCVSTSGHPLLREDALDTLIDELFPLSELITPNKMEASALLKQRKLPSVIDSLEDMLDCGRALLELGPRAVLLKGGHLIISESDIRRVLDARPGFTVVRGGGLLGPNMEILAVSESPSELVVDVLCHKHGSPTLFLRPRIESTSTHGTGCTLSAAIVSALAHGISRGYW
jgi:hydroxymethylpyrimidine/phosphomethylpyrimidine kinase / thiaminase